MSGVQIGVLVLIVAAFALGWWAARATARERAGETIAPPAPPEPPAPSVPDPAPALLAADAALAMWRLERGRLSPPARRAMIAAAGRLRALPADARDEAAAVRALASALEEAALTGRAAAAPPPVVEAARGILGRLLVLGGDDLRRVEPSPPPIGARH